MAKIKITCDSASDLPQALSRRYRIDTLPLKITLGKAHKRDQVDVDSRLACDYTEKTGLLPEISAVPVCDYRKAFLFYLSQGFTVIHISLSSAISGCYDNAREAASGLNGVYVVDSRSISSGSGQLALLAAELAGAEYRAEEIISALEDMKPHLEMSFVLQSSSYLRRSGKPGGLSALGNQLLRLKPEIFLKSGLIHRGRLFRGDMESAILSYVRSLMEGKHNIRTDRIFVTYAGVSRTTLDKVIGLLHQLQPFEEVLEAPARSVVSGRCGPSCLGLSYLTF